MKLRDRTPKTADERQFIKVGSFMGIGATILVIIPAVYRLANEPFQWADAALTAAGVGLAIVHVVRLIRLGRTR